MQDLGERLVQHRMEISLATVQKLNRNNATATACRNPGWRRPSEILERVTFIFGADLTLESEMAAVVGWGASYSAHESLSPVFGLALHVTSPFERSRLGSLLWGPLLAVDPRVSCRVGMCRNVVCFAAAAELSNILVSSQLSSAPSLPPLPSRRVRYCRKLRVLQSA